VPAETVCSIVVAEKVSQSSTVELCTGRDESKVKQHQLFAVLA